MRRPGATRIAVAVLAVTLAGGAAFLVLDRHGPEERKTFSFAELASARVTIGRYCLAKRAGRLPDVSQQQLGAAAELVLSATEDDPSAAVGEQRRRDLLADAVDSLRDRCDPQLAARLERGLAAQR